MNQSTGSSTAPRTAPHLAGVVILALAVIFGLHLAGFHFVMAGGVGR